MILRHLFRQQELFFVVAVQGVENSLGREAQIGLFVRDETLVGIPVEHFAVPVFVLPCGSFTVTPVMLEKVPFGPPMLYL